MASFLSRFECNMLAAPEYQGSMSEVHLRECMHLLLQINLPYLIEVIFKFSTSHQNICILLTQIYIKFIQIRDIFYRRIFIRYKHKCRIYMLLLKHIDCRELRIIITITLITTLLIIDIHVIILHLITETS